MLSWSFDAAQFFHLHFVVFELILQPFSSIILFYIVDLLFFESGEPAFFHR